jgi:nicotinate-nucleotide adenylyltransferase
MTIAVYSGSFNPFHLGHLDIIKTLAGLDWIGKVIVVVSPKNPGKSESVYISSPQDRLMAVKNAVEREGLTGKVEVSDIEFSRPQPIYTVPTLREIQTLYPDDQVLYVCGADCLEKIGRWRNGSEMVEDIGVIVFPRVGYDLEKIVAETLIKYPEAKIIRLSDAPREISSTEIRRRMENGEDYKDLVP